MRDLKNAFGQADDSFVANVNHTLADIKRTKGRKPVTKKALRLAAVAAFLCVVSIGTALALTNTWGILDFLRGRRIDTKVLPEAADIVQKDVAQDGGHTELVTFTVREAVLDGQNYYIVVDAKPAGSEYLLLGSDADPSDPIIDMGPLFSDKTGTIADYASEKKKEMIHTSVGATGGNCSIDYILEDDGTLTYMLNGSYTGGSADLTMELTCMTAPFTSDNGNDAIDMLTGKAATRDGNDVIDMLNKKVTTLSVKLKNTGTKGTVTSTAPATYADCGVSVDKITLTGSAMAIYGKIEFTVIDEEKYAETNRGLLFECLDANGERLPDGASSNGGIEAVDDTHYVQQISLQASQTLPEVIVLRGFNCWDKSKYETHTFEMK